MRPLLTVWRNETVEYCQVQGLAFRVDSSNADTKRGLLRDEVLPLLRRLHPAADANILRALDTRETLPPALAELLASQAGSKRVDLGGGRQVVREYDRLWLEHGPVDVEGEITLGRVAHQLRRCKGLRYEAGGPATGSPGGRRRSRTCSSTRRSPNRNARRGRSSCAATT